MAHLLLIVAWRRARSGASPPPACRMTRCWPRVGACGADSGPRSHRRRRPSSHRRRLPGPRRRGTVVVRPSGTHDTPASAAWVTLWRRSRSHSRLGGASGAATVWRCRCPMSRRGLRAGGARGCSRRHSRRRRRRPLCSHWRSRGSTSEFYAGGGLLFGEIGSDLILYSFQLFVKKVLCFKRN